MFQGSAKTASPPHGKTLRGTFSFSRLVSLLFTFVILETEEHAHLVFSTWFFVCDGRELPISSGLSASKQR